MSVSRPFSVFLRWKRYCSKTGHHPYHTVGLLSPADLAGYRTNQVYKKGSTHTPFYQVSFFTD